MAICLQYSELTYKDTHVTAGTLFTIARKNETSLGVNQYTNGWREVGTEHRLGFYGSMKKNETETFLGKWMELESAD